MLKQGDSLFNPLVDLGENVQGWSDNMQKRGANIGSAVYDGAGALKKGNYGQAAGYGMDAMSNVVGALGDTVGAVPMALADIMTPDALTTPLVSAIANSETAQEAFQYVEKFKKEHPQKARALGWASDFASFLPAYKAIHQVPKNMDTNVKGFYGGGNVGKVAGVARLLPDTTRRFVTQITSPKGTAIERELGVSQGLLEQNQRLLNYTDSPRMDKLTSELDDLMAQRSKAKLTRSSSAEDKWYAQTYLDGQIKKTQEAIAAERKNLSSSYAQKVAKDEAYKGSYQRGALEYAYLYDLQTGKNKQFLQDVYANFNIVDAGTMARVDFDNLLTKPKGNPYGNPRVILDMMDTEEAADAVMSTFHKKLMGWHGKGKRPQDVHLVVKDPFSQERMSQEFFGAQATNTAKNLSSGTVKIQPEDFADPDMVKTKLAIARLPADKRQFYEDKMSGGRFNKPETKERFDSIKQSIENLKRNISYDETTGLYSFQEALLSKSKALGGMNHTFVMDKKGNVMGLPNDGHDLFGLDPVGGKPLINVYPPFSFNVLKTKGKNLATYEKSMRSADAPEVQQQASNTLSQRYRTPLTNAAPDSNRMQTQAARTIRDTAANVTAKPRDYVEAGANTLGLGGMLTNTATQAQPLREPTEEQRRPPQGLLTGYTGRFL